MEWYGTLLPRLYRWLPARTVLEIAPGFGRWTQFLQPLAERLIIVDLSDRCIQACRERFADADNVSFHVNDGRSLPMVDEGTVDLAFSFDSLVHANAGVMEAYLAELARTLAPGGVAFIHHSNAGAYRARFVIGRAVHQVDRVVRRVGPVARRVTRPHQLLVRLGSRVREAGRATENLGWRAEDVTADLVNALCRKNGLVCRSQELVNWNGPLLTDCFSVLTPPGSKWSRQRVVHANPGFLGEAVNLREIERVYSGTSATRTVD
jgi:spermidine synthase